MKVPKIYIKSTVRTQEKSKSLKALKVKRASPLSKEASLDTLTTKAVRFLFLRCYSCRFSCNLRPSKSTNGLKKKYVNVSKFIENLVKTVSHEMRLVTVVIMEKSMPGAGFEPATMRSSAARSPRLSYPG